MLEGFEPPGGIIICYQRSVLEYCLRLEGLDERRTRQNFRGIVTLPSVNHQIGLLGGFGFGAPVAALLLEDFIALGTTRFISIGTAGGLQRSCRVGDLVVCERAIRDEGVSHHYLPPAKHADASSELSLEFSRVLTRKGLPFSSGCSWTIDTPYRESLDEARHYEREGVVCVEMEAAALFAVAQVRSVELASAFVISDLLAEGVWEPQMRSDETIAGLHSLYDAALTTLLFVRSERAHGDQAAVPREPPNPHFGNML